MVFECMRMRESMQHVVNSTLMYAAKAAALNKQHALTAAAKNSVV
jgi:hypothetical protein